MNPLYAITWFILLAWSICFSACEAEPEPIRGGNVDIKNEAIWLVSIQILTPRGWVHHCGGSLISERDIITAAHCFVLFTHYSARHGWIPNVFWDLKKEKFRVVIGSRDLTLKDAIPGIGIEKKINKVFIHKDYEARDDILINDIAVIRLKKPLNDEDRKINPGNKFGFIRLFRPNGTGENNCTGRGAFGAGFGVINIDENGGYERDGLRKILNVHFTEKIACPFPGLKLVHYVGETPAVQGFCRGDSGGSIYFQNGNNDFELVGVISTGPCDSDLRLRHGKTSKITFIPEYLDFIESIENVDERKIKKQDSLKKYEKSGATYFVLPDHNNIAKLKYFNKAKPTE